MAEPQGEGAGAVSAGPSRGAAEETPTHRYRLTYRKGPSVRFISHLDVMRALERGFRRASLPLAYSHGFNPHARMSIAAPLAVGWTAGADVLDVELDEPLSPEGLVEALRDSLPEDLGVVAARRIDSRAPAAMAEVRAGVYTVRALPEGGDAGAVRRAVARLLAAEQVLVERPSAHAGPVRTIDLRPLVLACEVVGVEPDPGDGAPVAVLRMRLCVGSRANTKPELVVEALAPPLLTIVSIHRDVLELEDHDGAAGAQG